MWRLFHARDRTEAQKRLSEAAALEDQPATPLLEPVAPPPQAPGVFGGVLAPLFRSGGARRTEAPKESAPQDLFTAPPSVAARWIGLNEDWAQTFADRGTAQSAVIVAVELIRSGEPVPNQLRAKLKRLDQTDATAIDQLVGLHFRKDPLLQREAALRARLRMEAPNEGRLEVSSTSVDLVAFVSDPGGLAARLLVASTKHPDMAPPGSVVVAIDDQAFLSASDEVARATSDQWSESKRKLTILAPIPRQRGPDEIVDILRGGAVRDIVRPVQSCEPDHTIRDDVKARIADCEDPIGLIRRLWEGAPWLRADEAFVQRILCTRPAREVALEIRCFPAFGEILVRTARPRELLAIAVALAAEAPRHLPGLDRLLEAFGPRACLRAIQRHLVTSLPSALAVGRGSPVVRLGREQQATHRWGLTVNHGEGQRVTRSADARVGVGSIVLGVNDAEDLRSASATVFAAALERASTIDVLLPETTESTEAGYALFRAIFGVEAPSRTETRVRVVRPSAARTESLAPGLKVIVASDNVALPPGSVVEAVDGTRATRIPSRSFAALWSNCQEAEFTLP